MLSKFWINLKLVFLTTFPSFSYGLILKGTVTDQFNAPLAFVTVFEKGSTNGVLTNQNGNYTLELRPGNHTIVFQLTGYRAKSEQIQIQKDMLLNISLVEDTFELKEIRVAAGAEDPAYPMIRSAQKKRTYYLNQVKSFSCDVYIKGLQRIVKYPKKIMGKEIILDNILDTATGIAYLSESYSKFYFKKPDKIKETLISSKVSGRNNAFTFNQATDILFNFYENVIQFGFSQRGLLSPISSTCFMNYRYKFIGSFLENGVWVNKIKVIPKRDSDPCFSGYIYICDSTWRIYSAELMVTKQNQIKFVDTVKISQIFLPVNDSVWMPFTNKFEFKFNFLGFYGDGYFNGINSNYVLNPETSSRFFNGEEWHVNEDANKRTEAYWDSLRPVPLTELEKRDYQKKDSLNKIWESKRYKDSLDKKLNKFKLINFFQGYEFRNSWKQYYLRISPPVTGFLFNTVQGLNVSTEISFSKRNNETRKEFTSFLNPSYGFSSEKLYVYGGLSYSYNPKKLSSFSVSGGKQLAQINEARPISGFANTLYSLLDKTNYMKLFEKDYVEIRWKNELLNGILLTLGTEFSERTPLINQSNFTFTKKTKVYTSNNPQNPSDDSFPFERSRKAELFVQVRLRLFQKYYTLPNRKITMGSKFPELRISYRKALPGIASSDVSFDFISVTVSDKFDLKRWGKGQILLRGGKFLNTGKMLFIDYKHFNGNQTVFSSFEADKFQLMNYYSNSTNEAFVEGWFEHNFSGLLTGRLPLLKKIPLEEFINFRYCQSIKSSPHMELGFGLKYFLVRTEISYSPTSNIQRYGFRFGLLF